jgi:hypothetical protein
MRLHLDLLGWLYGIWGGFGVLVGASLGLLALGTQLAVADRPHAAAPGEATVWVFLLFACVFTAGGAVALIAGHWLRLRRRIGRPTALALAVPNLLLVPFGTALGVYTFWALLNDDARREFGAPGRRAGHIESEE